MLDEIECFSFVILDAHQNTICPGGNPDELSSFEDLIRVLHHQAIIRSQYGLTFAPVDDDGIDGLVLGRGELDCGREGGSSEADNSGFLDSLSDFIGGQGERGLCSFEIGGEAIFSIIGDGYRESGSSQRRVTWAFLRAM